MTKSTDITESGTVTVALKWPTKLILRVDEMTEAQEPVMGGGFRTVKTARQVASVTLNGYAKAFGADPTCVVVGGYALTDDVPADFWNEWMRVHEKEPMVVNGLIFAYDTAKDFTRGRATEQAMVKSGVAPLKGGDDPRVPRSLSGLKITEADAKPAAEG